MVNSRASFVIRVWLDERGDLWGTVIDPMAEWQHPFHTIENLGQLIQQRLAHNHQVISEPSEVTIQVQQDGS